jgi:hypothetical protein
VRLKCPKGSQDSKNSREYTTSRHPSQPVHNYFIQALIRDGYRCMVTGHYDENSIDDIPGLLEKYQSERTAVIETQAAHIFPASTDKGVTVDGGNPKVRRSLLRSLPQL